MCITQNRRGYCFTIAIFAFVVGAIEITYAIIMIAHYKDQHKWFLAWIAAWIPILIAGIGLVVGTYLPLPHIRLKVCLLRTWIAVAMSFGLIIVIAKVVIIVTPAASPGIWRNILRIMAFCGFLLLVFSFVYFPCLYIQDLDEEIDF